MSFVQGIFNTKKCEVFDKDKCKCNSTASWKLEWIKGEPYAYYCDKHMKLIRSFLKHGLKEGKNGRD